MPMNHMKYLPITGYTYTITGNTYIIIGTKSQKMPTQAQEMIKLQFFAAPLGLPGPAITQF